MLKRTLALAFSAALVAASLVALPIDPAHAEMAAPTKESTKAKKELTPQQQKMKDCAPKWAAHKKEKNVKGRAEYRKFMSTCLKA